MVPEDRPAQPVRHRYLSTLVHLCNQIGQRRLVFEITYINIALWDHDDVQDETQPLFADELVPTAAGAIGVVCVVEESGFAKKGNQSAGVDRQFSGRLGSKQGNCQVGVFPVGVTPGGAALLDHGFHLPETWCEDTKACRVLRDKVQVPEAVA